MNIDYINQEWKQLHSIRNEMCNFVIQIHKPKERVGFYETVILEEKHSNIDDALKSASKIKNLTSIINPYIQVSIFEIVI